MKTSNFVIIGGLAAAAIWYLTKDSSKPEFPIAGVIEGTVESQVPALSKKSTDGITSRSGIKFKWNWVTPVNYVTPITSNGSIQPPTVRIWSEIPFEPITFVFWDSGLVYDSMYPALSYPETHDGVDTEVSLVPCRGKSGQLLWPVTGSVYFGTTLEYWVDYEMSHSIHDLLAKIGINILDRDTDMHNTYWDPGQGNLDAMSDLFWAQITPEMRAQLKIAYQK
jgi:hypothetical protein